MPKQKLARKPPQRRGQQGQVQKRGPHDPEHQEGHSVLQFRKADKPGKPEDDDERARPRTVRRESPL